MDAAELEAAGEEHVEVAALGVDIAGDIDDALRRAFEPVSYTHLDVYKRQLRDEAEAL